MRFHLKAFPHIGNERGLTLLELLMVVTILSAVAWMSLGLVNNNTDQVRFEDTRNRLQAIRRAIIGDTSRTLNGRPEVRGYVADMGRLPDNLNALIAREYCRNDPAKTTSTGCTDWVSQPAYSYNADYGLWSGWNGPYLAASELVGYPRFQDGWGNSNDNSSNFGWSYATDSPNAGDLTIQSLGRDGVAAVTSDAYEADYPPTGQPIIRANEYRVLLTDSGTAAQGDGTGGLRVDFGSPAGPGTVELCMALAFSSGGTIATMTSSSVTITWNGTEKVVEFVFEDATGPAYDEDTYLYLGQAAYGIFEYVSGTGACDTTKPFPTGASPWKTFTVVPGAVIQPFERNLNN